MQGLKSAILAIFSKGQDGRARISKDSFDLGSYEFLAILEGKIRKCLFFYVKIFQNNSVNLAASAQIKAISQIQYFLVFKCVIKGRKKNSNFFQVYFFQKFLLSGSSDQTLNSDYTNPVLFTKFAVCYDHFIRKKANFQLFRIHIPYARHINPLLIRNRS